MTSPSGALAQGDLPPLSCEPPTVTGTVRDGSELTGRAGRCTPIAGLTARLRWYRCSGETCSPAGPAGRSPLRHRLTPEDVGKRMLLRQASSAGLQSDIKEVRTAEVAPLPASNLAPPEIAGTPRVGELLQASAGFWAGTPPLTFSYRWQRCARRCADIPRATDAGYRVRPADAGRRLRVLVTARNAAAPAPPAASARSAVVATGGSMRMLTPFPTVVIAGHVFGRGALISSFVVRGPRGARVAVSCRGRGCPLRRQRLRIGRRPLRLRRFEGGLRAGIVIELRVTSPGLVGKFTRIVIRSGRVPKRTDRCLAPGDSRPHRCHL